MSYQIEADETAHGWAEIEPEFAYQRQTFQRRRDGIVLAIERVGMSSYNVVTLPEKYYQDNQVIDYVKVGVEPDDAAETAHEWMEQNNAIENGEGDLIDDKKASTAFESGALQPR